VSSADPVLDYLLSPQAIRARCLKLAERAEQGQGQGYFRVHADRLSEVSSLVLEGIRRRYPDLKIPPHSRWGHFQVGGVDRLAGLEHQPRARLDLVVVSVLLDAGSGGQWSYRDPRGGVFARSEGLAVASLDLFLSGAFSSDPADPLRVDAAGLEKLSLQTLAQGFQVGPGNPLAGVEGRLALLRNLGAALRADLARFGKSARPSGLLDFLATGATSHREIKASAVLDSVLRGLGSIWPGRLNWNGVSLGDVWAHSALGDVTKPEGWVPFHKLSQWLTYSLLDPIERFGLRIQGLQELTGLAEYRNGGLLLDSGLIELRDPALLEKEHAPSSELIVEWRALTVTWLDRIADAVRAQLGFSAEEFPLARVLEGGTWWSGRELAQAKRPGGGPPLKLLSDGTVF
jgi:hypothetical protein